MRVAALVVALVALSGCAAIRREPPSWERPAPVTTGPPAGTTPATPSTGTGPAPASPAASAPAVSPPAPALPPPSPTAPSPAATGPTPIPSPPLTASLPPAEMRRLQEDAQRRIDEAARLLRQLEGRSFAPKEVETLSLAQSLVEQARKALQGEEYERAANLAVKARTLAEDLSAQR